MRINIEWGTLIISLISTFSGALLGYLISYLNEKKQDKKNLKEKRSQSITVFCDKLIFFLTSDRELTYHLIDTLTHFEKTDLEILHKESDKLKKESTENLLNLISHIYTMEDLFNVDLTNIINIIRESDNEKIDNLIESFKNNDSESTHDKAFKIRDILNHDIYDKIDRIKKELKKLLI